MLCYICLDKSGDVVAPECGCAEGSYHRECVRQVRGYDRQCCAFCRRYDRNRPALDIFDATLIYELLRDVERVAWFSVVVHVHARLFEYVVAGVEKAIIPIAVQPVYAYLMYTCAFPIINMRNPVLCIMLYPILPIAMNFGSAPQFLLTYWGACIALFGFLWCKRVADFALLRKNIKPELLEPYMKWVRALIIATVIVIIA